MSESFLHQPAVSTPDSTVVRTWVTRLVFGLAIATLFLMALGSATRVMNAGLSCPDWPLCYGEFVPRDQMNLQVFLEWFHRLIATSMGFATIGLASLAWWNRRVLPDWTPWAATFALFLVVIQGILGGLTVTELLRFDIVTAHLGTGLLFFSTLVAIGTSLISHQGTGNVGNLKWVGLIAIVLVYLQSILGGLVSSQWALHQCLGTSQLCGVMNSHIAGVVPATIATLTLIFLTWRTPALPPLLRRWATLAGLCLLLQITLGVATFRLHLQVEPLTVAHQAVGASLLGTLIIFTILAFRDIPVLKGQSQEALIDFSAS
ncbi:heme A synthase [Phormidesmis priestleyi ULC007]|uniref:Heme A synthase n=1 Tax=Phormidesmis priestleyi ULC007 TaxID=1920490 RepID=A0A2T1DNV2_9CYAN|nr:heme A synthase [Phormidesmis priestleyi]PSB22135.1 heme A synthase [Phormidesmis priestleyi ULC007]PZO52604.1 MAG: heme A synthase [Phormidesmis priestleyi]